MPTDISSQHVVQRKEQEGSVQRKLSSLASQDVTWAEIIVGRYSLPAFFPLSRIDKDPSQRSTD